MARLLGLTDLLSSSAAADSAPSEAVFQGIFHEVQRGHAPWHGLDLGVHGHVCQKTAARVMWMLQEGSQENNSALLHRRLSA